MQVIELKTWPMDFWEQIVTNEYIITGVIIALIFFVVVPWIRKFRDRKLLKTATSLHRGTKSERNLVLKLLKQGIPAETIFHDICIEKSNGEFSQVDIVVAATEGIVVFEVKDFSGWIFGNGHHSHWTKVLAYGNRKYRFYNPIKQNQNHIKILRKYLGQSDDVPFFSIIVFYGNCELKEINFVPQGTFLVKPYRIFEVLSLIKKDYEAAPYTNKRKIFRLLSESVHTGANIDNQEGHIRNIDNMLGKNRIFD